MSKAKHWTSEPGCRRRVVRRRVRREATGTGPCPISRLANSTHSVQVLCDLPQGVQIMCILFILETLASKVLCHFETSSAMPDIGYT